MSKLHVDITRRLPGFELGVCFDADENCLALLGASGSGKSMTLRCIAGIERPDEGVITLNGKTLFDSSRRISLPPQKRNVGYLFQHYALFSHMTVEENVAAGLGHMEKARKGRIVEEQLHVFQLEELRGRYPRELSGGQQQRVALARVLAYMPDVLMLDEPFSALDSYLRWQLEPQMLDILSRYHGVPLYVSHNRDEAYRLCQRIAVVDRGHIVALAGKKELFENPGTQAAAVLTGCKNVSPAKKTGEHTLYAAQWGMTLTCAQRVPEGTCAVGVRAHDLYPAEADGVNVLATADARISEAPFSVAVMLRTQGEPFRWEIDRSVWARFSKAGLPEHVSIDPEKILCLKA